MNTFHLEILSPNRTFFVGEAELISIPVSDGIIGIMANHSPMTSAIPDGKITFVTEDGAKKICSVSQGILDVENNRVRLLCETALYPEEIDAETERKIAAEAQMRIKAKQSKKEYNLWKLALSKAINNLKVKNDGDINL